MHTEEPQLASLINLRANQEPRMHLISSLVSCGQCSSLWFQQQSLPNIKVANEPEILSIWNVTKIARKLYEGSITS